MWQYLPIFAISFFLSPVLWVQVSSGSVQTLPSLALEGLKFLRCFGMPRTVEPLPSAKPSFVFLRGRFSRLANFPPAAFPNYRCFLKLQGTTGRAGRKAKNVFKNKILHEFFRDEARPFMRKSATVYA